MTPEEPQLWIIVRNWGKFQHYRDRRPTWIKVYVELLDDINFTSLTPEERSLLLGIWLMYAKGRRNIPLDTRWLSASCHQRVLKRQLDSLNHAGFIEFSASKPLASRAQAREVDRDVELKDERTLSRAIEHDDEQPFDFDKINYLPRELP